MSKKSDLGDKREMLRVALLKEKSSLNPNFIYFAKDVKKFIKELKDDDSEDLAKFMHDIYEEFAKLVGWNTQESCKVDFKDLPQENKDVMFGVATAVLNRLDERIDKFAGEKLK